MDEFVVGGRPLRQPLDAVRRYCGLPWSGGGPEVWAYAYFDVVPSARPDEVGAVDVLCCAALHPGLSQTDLTFFVHQRRALSAWLAEVPESACLASADEATLARVMALPDMSGPVGLSLLSKVLHHKRPALVPMLDRALVDRYRPITGLRGESSWSRIVEELRSDLDSAERPITAIRSELGGLPVVPSALRVLDIAVWMDARG